MGTDKQSYLKTYLRDFEKYMLQHYGLRVDKTKRKKCLTPEVQTPAGRQII
jgi:hypothetical protein